jgi:hypothetical protein
MRQGTHTTKEFISMKYKKSTIIFAFFLTAITALVLSIGLNMAWFALYEFTKDSLSLSYFRTSCLIGGLIWFVIMVRNSPKILSDLESKE